MHKLDRVHRHRFHFYILDSTFTCAIIQYFMYVVGNMLTQTTNAIH